MARKRINTRSHTEEKLYMINLQFLHKLGRQKTNKQNKKQNKNKKQKKMHFSEELLKKDTILHVTFTFSLK